ncbi:MAG: chemotaxis protein CheW [Pseudomonadota bacterium]|nr:chemotaxis protein CheW [Pseudomonadota bacterium]MDP1904547.1 chemotaxis protein CheW [Pseudomonadota bacterium]MDP2353953.1 chemotaxis protein CheW [Pseudomonadota bacterium]
MTTSEIPDSPHARAVLHRRAVRLASETDHARQTPRGDLFLAVRLGAREHYGIPYRWLDEIVRPRGLTPVPGTPPFVAGVMPRRGKLLAVLDLARLLRVEAANEDASVSNEETRLVMVSAAGYSVGLRVAEVLGNDRYRAESLGPALPGAAAGEEHWITGIHAGRLAMLDLEALLGDPRIRIEEHT